MDTMTDREQRIAERAYRAGQRTALQHVAQHFRSSAQRRLSGVGDRVAKELDQFLTDTDED